MSNIKMCDFCGKVTNNIAAEIFIRPVDSHAEVFNQNRTGYSPQSDSYTKDACHDCVGKFFEVREIKVLEANGEL